MKTAVAVALEIHGTTHLLRQLSWWSWCWAMICADRLQSKQSSGTLAKSGEIECHQTSCKTSLFYWWYHFLSSVLFSGDRSSHGTVKSATRHKCVCLLRLQKSVCASMLPVAVDALVAYPQALEVADWATITNSTTVAHSHEIVVVQTPRELQLQ